eukprot:7713514-Lingulodinium_polyedra.AAC.1
MPRHGIVFATRAGRAIGVLRGVRQEVREACRLSPQVATTLPFVSQSRPRVRRTPRSLGAP